MNVRREEPNVKKKGVNDEYEERIVRRRWSYSKYPYFLKRISKNIGIIGGTTFVLSTPRYKQLAHVLTHSLHMMVFFTDFLFLYLMSFIEILLSEDSWYPISIKFYPLRI